MQVRRRLVHLDRELLDEVGQVGGGHVGQSPVIYSDVSGERSMSNGTSSTGATSGLASRLGSSTTQQSLCVGVLAVEQVGDVRDLLAQRLWVEAVFQVVRNLDGASTGGLVDGLLHRRCHLVGIHVHLAGDVAGGAADGLDQAPGGAQEPLLVGVQDAHQ